MGKNVSYRDILRHHANRMSQSQIATACGCARSTVRDVLKRAGKKMAVTDELTGELHDAWLFVACLPYNQKTFVAAYPNMEAGTWCQASADASSSTGARRAC